MDAVETNLKNAKTVLKSDNLSIYIFTGIEKLL